MSSAGRRLTSGPEHLVLALPLQGWRLSASAVLDVDPAASSGLCGSRTEAPEGQGWTRSGARENFALGPAAEISGSAVTAA